ncbi:hypothetical protein ULMS_07580 [Patiriisocius marinistellae]|uniref:Lipoprotein n=1 Tax=Patiriisocius marinistellae TaxID=2494560 RepID=A0A5J4FTZ1_9FLAO|nr:hypothetical protein [Patiriisocius marinistellae]GEQ85250.1 hypothetical protein ULMS_07580 [Patiriisocius marinistellae]
MKLSVTTILVFTLTCTILISCGTPTKKNKNIIGPKTTQKTSPKPKPTIEPSKITKPSIPDNAVIGNYNGDLVPFYARINKIDTNNGVTHISFQDNRFPKLLVPKTYGGTISPLVLEGFDRDLLLLTAKLKDENFNKYFLYVLRNNQWKPVMNGFAIHKSNKPETLQIIRVNPEKPNELLRYYSVFNIDENSETGYAWLLLEESVPKMAW